MIFSYENKQIYAECVHMFCSRALPRVKSRQNGSKSKPWKRPISMNLLAPNGFWMLTHRKFKVHLSGFAKFTCSVMAPMFDDVRALVARDFKQDLTAKIEPYFQANPVSVLNCVRKLICQTSKLLWGGATPRFDVIHQCNCFVIRHSS